MRHPGQGFLRPRCGECGHDKLLAFNQRVFDIEMQHCPNSDAGELKSIAAHLERPVIERFLTHLGLNPLPPPRGRAREAGQDFAT